jgi:hypothetical protein
VGLVTREEFLNKRNTLKERMNEATAKAKREAERAQEQVWHVAGGTSSSNYVDNYGSISVLSTAHPRAAAVQERVERAKKKAKIAAKTKLSFGDDEDEEGEEQVGNFIHE